MSRIRYPYTEGEVSDLAATETHTYSYNNSLCGDVLTGYNGQSVSYDNIGNITGFDGKEYTWTAGRQLSRMRDTEDGSYIDYCYDDNGMLNSFSMYNPDGTLSGVCYYFWNDTKLIAMQMIEYSEDENGNAVASEALRSRVIYDSDGEPLGYLLNDAMPMLYTKNILGDITGIVNIETGQLMFNYVYDAFGNMEIKTPNGTVGEAFAAMLILITNPLSYRGYLYAPMAGYSYYLGSRFYAPTLCRFMNADVYYDTATGVNGTNKFIYCNNNPVAFADPNGTSYTDGTGALQLPASQNEPSPLGLSGVFVVIFNFRYLIAFLFGSSVTDSFLSQPSQGKIDKADKNIRDTVKQSSNDRYWKATVMSGYVKLGDAITFNQAVRRVKNGNSVFTVMWYEAKEVAIAAGGKSGSNNKNLLPEIDKGKENVKGYYYHYHTYNRKGGHVYYLY